MTPWIDKRLGDVCTLQRGFDLPKRLRRDGHYPLVTSAGVDGSHAVGPVRAPGVVTGRYGTVGKVFFVEDDFWPLNTTLFVRDFHGNDPRFVYHLLQTVDFETHSGKSGVPGVNRNDVHEERARVPENVDEQADIARALTDADALIDSLEQLLSKKRQIKQGAMQELLISKRRLPGFKATWSRMRLDELADIRSGGTPNTRRADCWGGSVPWCTPTDITALAGHKYLSATERTISDKGLKESSAELLPAGTVVMTSRATIGECAIAALPLATNQGFKNFVPKAGTSGEFLFYLLVAQKRAFLSLCAGSTFLEIGKRQLADFEVFVPPDPDEQHAIAQVLSDIDTDLSAIEAHLAKARDLKRAMMQVLLTGRIRLVQPEAA